MLTCSSCAHENPNEQKFCGECGTKLEATVVREERKVITALFCDLVGSTALGERLDAEDISRLLRSYQQICRKRIESHGGVVEKFIGDAVVGVFGVPLAHEDDPERAVRAALRITEDIGASDLGVEVRIGVNTGEALVRLDVDPRSGEGFATGDTMNTAARLEAAAPVMGVAVGSAAHRASIGAIVYEELPRISAKGKAEPVTAWRALRPIARVGTEERDRTPFVGRDLELSMLTQLFDRSRSRPSTEFVTIIADPGLGKSRLVRELARQVDQLPELVTWREGRCLPYGDGISFWALGEIVKAQAGILETDDRQTVSSKLDQVLTESDEQTRTWIKDRIGPLVGLETTTEPPQRDEAFTAWRRFLEEIAGAGPTVLVIEDLHWADEAFVAFLEHLTERTAGLPLLVIVTARPEVEERHPSWPPGRRSTVLSLPPLTDENLETLIMQSLPEADTDMTRVVLERAGGSPLYAEQLAAMLRERALPIAGGALDETMIPSSVQALIAARIDALPAEPKRVLMEASVVGKTFWSGAITSLGEHEDIDGTLGELVRREFCRPVHPSTMEGDAEFGFWHALVRDVAYAELTKAERARMHAATARWIADRTAGSMGEDAEIVVHHLDAALGLAPSAPELDSERLTNLLAEALYVAGDAAMRTDVPRAMRYLERGLKIIGPDDPHRVDVLRLLGIASDATGHPGIAAAMFEEVFSHHATRSDMDALVDSAFLLGGVLWGMGDGARAADIMRELGERLGSTPSPALARWLSWRSMETWEEDDVLAARYADESIEMAGSFGVEPRPIALAVRGGARVKSGDLGGEADVRLAVEASLREGRARGATVTLCNFGAVMSAVEPSADLRLVDEAASLADRLGMEAEVWTCRAMRLESLARLGRFDEVETEAEPILAWAAERNDAFARFMVLLALAMTGVERGGQRVDPAELADLAKRLSNEHGLVVAAQIALRSGDFELARSLLPDGVAHCGVQDAFSMARTCVGAGLPKLAEEFISQRVAHYAAEDAALMAARAILDETMGDLDAASEGYLTAAAMFEQVQMVPDQAHALEGLGRCLLFRGVGKDGVARLHAARALLEQLKATHRIAEIDELLATTSLPDGGSA
jgi:class 3 adenylate cyclase